MQHADRLNAIDEYYFSKKLREVSRMVSEGKPIINLGIGSPDRPPPKQVVDVLQMAAQVDNNHGYQSYIGIPELRNAISIFYKRWYHTDLDPENEILPTMGSKEAIMHISLAFLNKGDKVLIPELGYPTYTSVTRLTEAEPVFYSLDNNWEPDWERMEEIDLRRVKLMWINYPHMPSGSRGSLDLFKRAVEFGSKNKILVVNDNPYSFILNKNPESLLSLTHAKEYCLELNSLSKAFNMAGWRVGWVAGRKEYIQNIIKVKSNMDSGMFRPIQLAAAEALKMKTLWFDELNEVYRDRRVVAERIFNKLNVSFNRESVGMFLWGKTENKTGEMLSDELLYNKSIFITPGLVFGEKGDQYIRLSLCQPAEKMEEALNRL